MKVYIDYDADVLTYAQNMEIVTAVNARMRDFEDLLNAPLRCGYSIWRSYLAPTVNNGPLVKFYMMSRYSWASMNIGSDRSATMLGTSVPLPRLSFTYALEEVSAWDDAPEAVLAQDPLPYCLDIDGAAEGAMQTAESFLRMSAMRELLLGCLSTWELIAWLADTAPASIIPLASVPRRMLGNVRFLHNLGILDVQHEEIIRTTNLRRACQLIDRRITDVDPAEHWWERVFALPDSWIWALPSGD